MRLPASAALAALLLLAACTPPPTTSTAPPVSPEWHEFQGTWTAAGTRQTLKLGSDEATIATLDGALVLSGASSPGAGFRANAVVLEDSVTGVIGRAVWTDSRGEQLFSNMQRAGGARGTTIYGTFRGGTGRYAGATGTYQFSWRFQIATEDGTVQGQSEGFTGRVRVGE